jgi:two-component system invasion response regulator UvrY
MIRVLITDDHAIVRIGLKQLLAETSDIVVGGEADNAQRMLQMLADARNDYDVLVLDINMPGRSGFDVLKDIQSMRPNLPILIQSMHSEDQFAVRVLKAGAAGYITKESAPDELIKAIRKVCAGGRYVSQALGEKLALGLTTPAELPHETLSDREYQILYLLASGRMVKEIAAELGLSVKTVSTYRTRVMEKLRFKSNTELTRYALDHKLIE